MQYQIKSADPPLPLYLFFGSFNPLVTRCELGGVVSNTLFPLTPSPSSLSLSTWKGLYGGELRASKIVNGHSALKIREGQEKLYPGNKIMEKTQEHNVHARTRVEKLVARAEGGEK